MNEALTENRRSEPVKKSRIFLAAMSANLAAFITGTAAGWTSPIIPKLKSPDTSDSPLSQPIGPTEDGLLISLIAIGAIVAPFPAGYLADNIGRKRALLCSAPLFVIGFLLMPFANQIWMILLGRLVHGFGAGFVFTLNPMYLGEISTDDVRGTTSSLFQISLVVGILFTYAIGPYVSYYTLQYVCLVAPIIFIAFFSFMPESPYYYLRKSRKAEALKSLQFLRGQSTIAAQDELAEIQANVEESMSKTGKISDIFTITGNRKAFFICLGLMALQHLSGINVLLSNYQSVFESANTNLDPAMLTIIVGIVQVVGSALTPIFADRLGRKTILLTSSSIMTISLAILGIYFYVKHVAGEPSNFAWLPLLTIVVYNIAYFAGFGPIPWAILGEVFSTNIKAIALPLVSSSSWVIGFLIFFVYPMLNTLGVYYAIWLFAILCAVAFFFTMFVVTETKGLSFKEIQDRLNGTKL